ncbi:hypothetical protein [Caldimonas brevitalea]|uniref:Aminoacyl-tRNA synthetase class I anticodon-binding domain-containing protein n=1 Tax=Caldimonas brevitalea TaxID=413882 RepID=A0A0G3BKS6_9BURK|nr:hypothetical protein [Caldimonas brevitalea]AKJ30059.1 hypothetical protein AAW51_3368 [Caldimonas brevitalea]
MDANDEQRHAELTMRYATEQLGLAAMLRLTHGLARPGQEALDMVLPVLVDKGAWMKLHLLEIVGLSPNRTRALLEQTLELLSEPAPWSEEHLRAALQTLAQGVGARGETAVELLLRIVMLRGLSPLPVVPVMAILGRERSVQRLRAVLVSYVEGQLIG